ncbi:hypothetical protein G6F38_012310 [Rhizopus arrhizus]|nr:hypothetical protein G6F38_012310 [Rhizopus arrhizus]
MNDGYIIKIAVDDDTIPKLTMSTPWGLFSYCVMPFGIKSSPAVFCRMIYLAMEKFLGKGVSTYIDDMCAHNNSFEEHLSLLEQVLRRLHEVNLVLKPNKCVWCQREVEVLGFIVSPTGITPNPKNVEKIVNFKRPHNVKDIRAFTALAGFYRCHIQGFGEVTEPLNRLLKKNTSFCLLFFNTWQNITAPLERSILSILYYTLWSLSGSMALHQDHASIFGMGTLLEHSNQRVLGRLDYCGGLTRAINPSHQFGPPETTLPRLVGQPEKIDTNTVSNARTSRLLLEYNRDDSSLARQETSGHSAFNSTNPEETCTISEDNPQLNDEHSSSNFCDSTSPYVHTVPATTEESDGKNNEGLGPASTVDTGMLEGTELAEDRHRSLERSQHSAANTSGDDLCGREQLGLGLQYFSRSSDILENGTRVLESRRIPNVHQLERTQGSADSSSTASKPTEQGGINQNGC